MRAILFLLSKMFFENFPRRQYDTLIEDKRRHEVQRDSRAMRLFEAKQNTSNLAVFPFFT